MFTTIKGNKIIYGIDGNTESLILEHISQWQIVKEKKMEHINIPCSFDIETSSFYNNNEKQAVMYIWQFCINGEITIIGRTWDEFSYLLSIIKHIFNTSKSRILYVYVHNLSYEFQFMRKHITNWSKVFSTSTRTPIYARTEDGIEFRCSYILSGYSLQKLASELQNHTIEKLVGDLDYSLIRHPKTPMTEEELMYCINDVIIVCYYISEEIERNKGKITNIPITKTGYVRRYCRDMCMHIDENGNADEEKYPKYRSLMNRLTLDGDTYNQLKRAFQGGFTHCNGFYNNIEIPNVTSYDFTSSYPYVMISEKYPMSAPQSIEIHSMDELKFNLSQFCCLFDVEFINIEARVHYENIISKSKCLICEKAVIDNGRVAKAERILTTCTDVDFMMYSYFYTWEKMHIRNFKRFKKGYLPKDLILSILKLYKDKTVLKGVKGKEVEYMLAKSMLNSVYGMCVTDICKDENIYEDDEWSTQPADINKSIDKNNKSKNRFLYYPWGVWVTAYARKNLFTGIKEFGETNDYIYSDTDSIKVTNIDSHMKYIRKYNDSCDNKLRKMCEELEIDIKDTKPKTIKGVEKPLGVWDFDGHYDRFKTLGAKRYLTESDGEYHLTVAGVGKQAIKYLEENGDPFKQFNNKMRIPSEYTGKMTHTYIDHEISGVVQDYLGEYYEYHELSCIHLENTDFNLSLADEYVRYLLGIKEVERIEHIR